ncbi:type II toxin-antitoxin system HicB family antitoxin [Candidatus Microgenomates bacterium]|nr:type II toxin-antitoxin system HicB family antitoxin [Candidatus Microgenomates bacterium]
MPKVKNFKVIIEQDEDGIFAAEVPAIPGCYTQGKTYEEAIKNVKEVIELCLEEAKENPGYLAKIDLEESSSDKFLGITNVPVKVSF